MLALKSFFILGAATLAAASLGDTCKTVSVNDQGIMKASCGDGKGGWNDASLDLNKCFKRSQDPPLIYMPDQDGSDVTDCLKDGPFDITTIKNPSAIDTENFSIGGACLKNGETLGLDSLQNYNGNLAC
ncbi:hypothetical protein NUU61_005844 [Penicillium alfredii]|uniref:Cyanovirin-N domain-containing protein n=1 Tax=Penicillium alfredii TaxID=1506179 RepID=A0A9W9FA86_9EURO|nr:uncharacterized protein NUU61_005844 [Penicillium alfredii]KAJ5096488.1 hypothetical protein NUU61_005844 [Penicillium alfredii]